MGSRAGRMTCAVATVLRSWNLQAWVPGRDVYATEPSRKGLLYFFQDPGWFSPGQVVRHRVSLALEFPACSLPWHVFYSLTLLP